MRQRAVLSLLPSAHEKTPQIFSIYGFFTNAGGRARTGTVITDHGILSPGAISSAAKQFACHSGSLYFGRAPSSPLAS